MITEHTSDITAPTKPLSRPENVLLLSSMRESCGPAQHHTQGVRVLEVLAAQDRGSSVPIDQMCRKCGNMTRPCGLTTAQMQTSSGQLMPTHQ